MRILWSSNAIFCSTGYGIQARHLLPRFVDLGHDVAQHAWYGLQGGMLNLDLQTPNGQNYSLPVYPGALDPFGNDVVEAHAKDFKADVMISLMDAWVLKNYGQKDMRWICYAPIDHNPIPPKVLTAMEGVYRVVSYSRWGEKLLNDTGVVNTYIPHGVDTKTFAPKPKHEARKALGIDSDCFLIGMVAANKGNPARKAFAENLSAVAQFKRHHPTLKVRVYLHTTEDNRLQGIDFNLLLSNLGFRKEEIIFINQYRYLLGLSEEYMANAYNAMDVLLAASMTEGFGIPLIESQSCGTPVITTRYASMTELCFGGWLAEPTQPFWSGLDSWVVIPSIESIVDGLESAYQHRNDTGLQHKARAGAMAYDWDTVVKDYWKPFLDEVQMDVDRQKRITDQRIPECRDGHAWFATGVFDYDGLLHIPCKRKDCAAVGALVNGKVITLSETGFETVVNGIALDLEDNPTGGVAKVICLEIQRDYALDDIEYRPGDIVLDIGAQVGVVSCYLGKKYPEIKIYAYEPDPSNYNHLLRNLKANGVTNVTAFNQAVTGDGRLVSMYGDANQNSGGLTIYGGDGTARDGIQSTTLAEIIRQVGAPIRLLKIDCEGAEYEVIGDGAVLDSVDFLRGEFHFGKLLTRQGFRPDALMAICNQHIVAGKSKVKIQQVDR